MQCFICMTYMIFICSAHPGNREPSQPERRSLFRDVIESLRIRSQIPDEYNQNDENNLSRNYDRYGYENEPPQLPSDRDFIPRRNDRIEMPSLKYRFPKSLSFNNSNDDVNGKDNPKNEIVLYIDTTKEPIETTQKPKKQKRPRPTTTRTKPNNNKYKDEEIVNEDDNVDNQKPEEHVPLTNTMAGQSQIGNRDSQMVVKPTVIVNIRGTVTHRDSDIRIEGVGSNGGHKEPTVKQDVKVLSEKEKARTEEDMMMCETATWNPEKNREGRKFDNVLQIMFSLTGQ